MRVIAISGYSGTGKTSLIEVIIRELVERGYSVATIKSSKHDAGPEQGTDTWKHKQAGASLTLFLGPKRKSTKFKERVGSEQLARLAEYDFLLVEGMKSANIPRLWCVGNREIESEDIPSNTKAIVSWTKRLDSTVEGIIVISTSELNQLIEVVETKSVEISEIE